MMSYAMYFWRRQRNIRCGKIVNLTPSFFLGHDVAFIDIQLSCHVSAVIADLTIFGTVSGLQYAENKRDSVCS